MRTCTVSVNHVGGVETHADVVRANNRYGSLHITHADYSETVYAAREWTRYHLSAPDAEPVSAVRDPDNPDALVELLADGAVRRPSPSDMPTRRAS